MTAMIGAHVEPDGEPSDATADALPPALDFGSKRLKLALRSLSIPLEHELRRDLWTRLAARQCARAFDDDFDGQLAAVGRKLPAFVEPAMARFFRLRESARHDLTSVLWSLAQSCPHITHAPLLYPLCALFMHFHSAADTFTAAMRLLAARDLTFVGTSRADKNRDGVVLVKLTNRFGVLRKKCCLDARQKLRRNALDTAFAEFQSWIWTFLPFRHCVRVVDCFLVEGEKFLYRIALTLALLFEQKSQQKPITLERMRVFCESIGDHLTPGQLVATAVKMTRLSRKDIARARTNAESRLQDISLSDARADAQVKRDVISAKEYTIGARIAPRRFKSAILDWTLLDLLFNWLPDRVLVREPTVVFNTEEDGNSLQTFFASCADNEPTVLLVKTIHNDIFGAFCSTAWSKRFDLAPKVGQFFGTGETFVFALAPEVAKYEWIGKRRASAAVSHAQQLFQSASLRSLSIGSGNGTAIFLDENLSRGRSERCDTFDNESLCASKQFSVAVVEVIAFS